MATIKRIEGGFDINGERIAKLSDDQLQTLAATGDITGTGLTTAAVQSAAAELLYRRGKVSHG